MKNIDLIKIVSYVALVIISMGIIGSCKPNEVDIRLDLAEDLMEERPDSSLFILEAIDELNLKEGRTKARYALLKSMALDKNYIDTTTFDVLQPAIDYFLKEGNADEKLMTYYYQGRIHRNAGDDDLSMQSYINALENLAAISDSLMLARTLVAQAVLFYKQYKIQEFVENCIEAGKLYGLIGKTRQQLISYSKAIDGLSRLKNKSKADSIISLCRNIIQNDSTLESLIYHSLLVYTVSFGNIEDIQKLITEVLDNKLREKMTMDMARAYSKIGSPEVGLMYLNETMIPSYDIHDSLSYWAINTEILEQMGNDKEALNAFKNYSRVLEIYHGNLFSNELLFSDKKHEMEIVSMKKLKNKDDAIRWILVGVVILICVIGLIYYRYRLNKAGRMIAEQSAQNLLLDAAKFKLEGEKQRLLAEKFESESRRLRLEAENLHLHIRQLEDESDRLKDLLGKHETLSEEARQVIRERISMLNGLFAQALTNQESYGKEFNKYVEKIKKDKKRFQESIVKVLEGTHPEFMGYLKAHDLTEREIGYVCLYAIGLRGKEIGNYLDLVRHYNISTDIRRKLGLETNSENLVTFLRKLMSDNHK